MSVSLSIVNNFSVPINGFTVIGNQGMTLNDFADAYKATVTGEIHQTGGQLATATVRSVYETAGDYPTSWSYLWLVADQICYVQLIGSATNAIFKLAAYLPFVLPGYNKVLAAANTTAIAGNSEPAVTTIANVYLGTYSGTTLNYQFAVIN